MAGFSNGEALSDLDVDCAGTEGVRLAEVSAAIPYGSGQSLSKREPVMRSEGVAGSASLDDSFATFRLSAETERGVARVIGDMIVAVDVFRD